jgi:hypothetical protein
MEVNMKKLILPIVLLLLVTSGVFASDYYIFKKTIDNRFVDLYVHLPIPDTQTTAGSVLGDVTLTYRRVVKESLVDTTSAIPVTIITTADLPLSDMAMVTGGTTLTSVTGGLTSNMVGSRLNIASGTNFVAGDYKVVGYNSENSLELDRDATNGSNASSGVGTVIARQTMLDNGELYEKRIRFRFDSLDLTNTQRRSQIENGNNNQIGVSQMLVDIATPGSDLWNEVLEPLEWWGYHRIIP